ncbi:MAG: long-chain fatty acid--CoA ligase, partial [Sorangium cellulosum]
MQMDFVPKFLTIVDLFEKSVKKFASRDHFGVKVDGVWTWTTYAETKRRVDGFRRALADAGIKENSCVAIISNNCIQWAIASFATVGLGAHFVPMYESQLPKEWEFILRDCEAEVLIVATEAIYQKTKLWVDELPSLKKIVRIVAPESEPDSFEALVQEGTKNPMPPSKPT